MYTVLYNLYAKYSHSDDEESTDAPSSPESGFSGPSCTVPDDGFGCYSYILVGDNIDKTIRARNMTMDHQNQSLHFFHCYAALDRINFTNAIPLGQPADLPLSIFLPDLADCTKLRENYTILIGREVVKKLTYFKIFEKCLPKHIPHAHSQEMSRKSTVVCDT